MSVDYGLMRTLHRMLRQLTDIAERLRKGPLQLKMAMATEKQLQAAVEVAKEQHQKTVLAAKAKDLQLGEREAKIEDMRAKLNAAESNKEFQLLKDRIAADEQANSVLSDEILEMYEKIDMQSAAAKKANADLAQAKSDMQKLRDKVKAEQESLAFDEERIRNDLAVAQKGLHLDIGVHFNRLVNVKGEETFAETNTETCGNCHVRVTAQTVNDLLMRKPVFCKGCDAILYLSENHPHLK